MSIHDIEWKHPRVKDAVNNNRGAFEGAKCLREMLFRKPCKGQPRGGSVLTPNDWRRDGKLDIQTKPMIKSSSATYASTEKEAWSKRISTKMIHVFSFDFWLFDDKTQITFGSWTKEKHANVYGWYHLL